MSYLSDYDKLTRNIGQTIDLSSFNAALRQAEDLTSLDDDGSGEPVEVFWGPEDLQAWQDELINLTALADALQDEIEVLSRNGTTLIHEHYFTDYIREQAEETADLGDFRDYIDWERYASDAKMDHTSVWVKDGEFAGYWYYQG